MVVSFVEWWVPQIRTRTRVAATTPEWSLRRPQQEIWRPISSTVLLVINLCWGWLEMRDTGGLRAKFAGDPALTLTPPGQSARNYYQLNIICFLLIILWQQISIKCFNRWNWNPVACFYGYSKLKNMFLIIDFRQQFYYCVLLRINDNNHD